MKPCSCIKWFVPYLFHFYVPGDFRKSFIFAFLCYMAEPRKLNLEWIRYPIRCAAQLLSFAHTSILRLKEYRKLPEQTFEFSRSEEGARNVLGFFALISLILKVRWSHFISNAFNCHWFFDICNWYWCSLKWNSDVWWNCI